MNERDKVTELLKNYRSYRYAANNLDGTDGYLVQDWGSVRIASARGDLIIGLNEWDYRRYSRIVTLIDGAVQDVLDDDMQNIIRYKYLERNTLTLSQISDKFHYGERRAQYLHKKALKALTLALGFADAPEIHNLDHMSRVKIPVNL